MELDKELCMMALSLSRKVSHRRYILMAHYFGDPVGFFKASEEDVHSFFRRERIESFPDRGELLGRAHQLAEENKERGTSFISYDSEYYPTRLREIHSPPIGLFVRGELEPFHDYFRQIKKRNIAIIGTRKARRYTCDVAYRFASDLGENGFNIISGFAEGVDRAAHEGALEVGRTIAVFGCGINQIYPRAHRGLYRDILERGGLVLSEFPPDETPRKEYFPMRNRIISGLSDGVIMMEASEKSGALITARYAVEQNKDLFVFSPKEESLHYSGNFRLIREGATAIADFKDIVRHLYGDKIPGPIQEEGDDALLKLLVNGPVSINEIAQCLSRTPDEMLTLIMPYVLEGKVVEVPGNKYYLKPQY